jgi:hypothetical protein
MVAEERLGADFTGASFRAVRAAAPKGFLVIAGSGSAPLRPDNPIDGFMPEHGAVGKSPLRHTWLEIVPFAVAMASSAVWAEEPCAATLASRQLEDMVPGRIGLDFGVPFDGLCFIWIVGWHFEPRFQGQ